MNSSTQVEGVAPSVTHARTRRSLRTSDPTPSRPTPEPWDRVLERWSEPRPRPKGQPAETVVSLVAGEAAIVSTDSRSDLRAILERVRDRATVTDLGSYVRVVVPLDLVGNVAGWIVSAARQASGKRQAAARDHSG